MSGVFGWLPLVWAMRIALLVLLAGCSYVYLLLIAPFFRPSNVRRMVRADLPRVRAVGAEVAGTNAEVQFDHRDESRLEALEQAQAKLAGEVERLSERLEQDEPGRLSES